MRTTTWIRQHLAAVRALAALTVVTGIANTIYIWLRARSERWLK